MSREAGAAIRAERERLGLSISEAARRLGVARQTYQQLEGRANPRLDTLLALRGIGYDLDAILSPGRGPPAR